MMSPNALLTEQAKLVAALGPILPSSSTPVYVSLKNYEKVTILIQIVNATTVTGSAITVKQATDVSNSLSDEKPVAFATARRNIDTDASDELDDFTVSSNTFTTDVTNSKKLMYVIEIKADDLDVNNGFDCIRLGTGTAVALDLSATYILWPAKFGKTVPPSAIVD